MVFLKLGGSLITDKRRAYALRRERLDALAQAIAAARRAQPEQRLLLGHGSGSFGHWAARESGFRTDLPADALVRAAAQVWLAARRLNHEVIAALHRAGVPALAFPPSAAAYWEDDRLVWPLTALQRALAAGFVPVVYCDMVLGKGDAPRAAIASTEALFAALAPPLRPRRILVAGVEAGVWADYPQRQRLIAEITPQNAARVARGLHGAAGADVTGGMAGKVAHLLRIVSAQPEIEAYIFDGRAAETVQAALLGRPTGTRIAAEGVPDRV